MKQLLLFAGFIIASFTLHSQSVRKDANGNYYAVKAVKDSVGGKPTGKTFTDSDGTVYPILEGSRGGHYIMRISRKTGKPYPKYLKLEN